MQSMIKTLQWKVESKSPVLRAKLEAEHKSSYENLKWEYQDYKWEAQSIFAESNIKFDLSKNEEPPSFLELS